MSAGTPEVRGRNGARRAWAHVVALVVLAGAVDVAGALSGGGGVVASLRAALAGLPDFYFGALPVLVAISVGMLSFTGAATRHAAALVVATVVAMIVLDLVGGHGIVDARSTAMLQPGSVQSAASGDFTNVPLFATIWHILREGASLPATQTQRYDLTDPRLRAAFAVLKGAHLLLPVALVGIVLGVQAWVADHVVFRQPVDELVARMVLAWVFAPAGFYLALSWGRKLCAQVLFYGAWIFAPLLPIAVMLLAAALGWVAARRVTRWSS